MGLHVPENIAQLKPYPPGKPIEELEREYGISGSIKLASNENPLGPSPLAIAAIQSHLQNLHRYPDGSGFYLRKRLSTHLQVPESAIVLGNGSNEIIDLLIRTFVRQGDEVLMAAPTFLVYHLMVRVAGGKPVEVPLKGFTHDLQAMTEAITSRTRLIFLNNPNNPTGTVLSRQDMDEFLDRVPQDVPIVVDEAYFEFANPEKTFSGLEYLDSTPPVIVLRTFSKAYGLAGLRIGYGVMIEEIADYLNRVRQPFNVNTLAQVAALAALDDEDFLQRTREVVREELRYLYQEMARLQLPTFPTETNFFLIQVDCDAREVYQALLKKGVIVRAMNSYGLANFIRISPGRHEENLRFVAAIEEVMNSLRKG
ncbi:MAG: histidinol-phosphate transaminase [Deltaproteobacteria bacterium]|nr:histidinol-phosphate transaminase [Deltaproteobacteria bacterium]MBW2069883.1 histidinol-phosphate transaminase [Deltaproteobacteria bacterium]